MKINMKIMSQCKTLSLQKPGLFVICYFDALYSLPS